MIINSKILGRFQFFFENFKNLCIFTIYRLRFLKFFADSICENELTLKLHLFIQPKLGFIFNHYVWLNFTVWTNDQQRLIPLHYQISINYKVGKSFNLRSKFLQKTLSTYQLIWAVLIFKNLSVYCFQFWSKNFQFHFVFSQWLNFNVWMRFTNFLKELN